MPALRVLLIEGDDAYATAVAAQVHSAGVETERVITVAEAQARLALQRFDAVLLDLDEPDTHGLQRVEALHRLAGGGAVIVLTSSAGEQMALLAMQHGAQDYLLKHEIDGPSLARAVRYARERAAVHQAMRDSEARFRALVEHAYDVITLIDERGFVLFDSRSLVRVTGFTPEERLGRHLEEFLHPDDVTPIRERFAYSLTHPDEPLQVEYRFLHKDGSWRWGEAIGVNRLDDPIVRGIVVNHRDVSARKQAEQALQRSEDQLRQAQKMEAVGRLAGGIAHDFNNVLTAIFGYADLLLDQFGTDDRRRADVLEIRRSAERAAALTRQLLAFSRKQVMQPRTIDLNGVIRNIENLLGRLVGEDIEVVLDLDPALEPVRADPGQMEQVLMNLAANARDAMPEGGRFCINTANMQVDETAAERPHLQPGRYAKIAVRDYGTGVSGEIREHIFEPFFTTKEVGKGTGLGLATVYGIIKQSGGNIYLESCEGQGTTFGVYLPSVERDQ